MAERDAQREVAFPKLTKEQIAALEEFATRRRFADGEPLFQTGERHSGFFVVLSGAVEVLELSTGEPRRVAVHGPGAFTGDVDIVSRRPPVVTAVARGGTEALEISSTDIRRIISERPSVGELILQAFRPARAAGGVWLSGAADHRLRGRPRHLSYPRVPGPEPGAVYLDQPGHRSGRRGAAPALRRG